MTTTLADFALTAPGTDRSLTHDGEHLVDPDGARHTCDDGIWDLLRPDRRPAIERFVGPYARIRSLEQRTPLTAEAVAALPYRDLAGGQDAAWAERAASYDRFRSALAELAPTPGRMVDVGAGCAWLAARLATDGWSAAAVDVTVEAAGLAAARLHPQPLLLLRAEMDALPFAPASVDLVVLNAALHYAPDVGGALDEAIRVLHPGGVLAVLDSPVFRDADAGRRMVEEFAAETLARHGAEAAPLPGPGFVTVADLEDLRRRHRPATWQQLGGRRGLTGAVRRRIGARRAGRETADRPLLLATTPTRPTRESR